MVLIASTLLALASTTLVYSAPLEPRAVTCSSFLSGVSSAGQTAQVQTFCRSYLNLAPRTLVVPTTSVAKTIATTTATTKTSVRAITPAVKVIMQNTQTTVRTTVTPVARTVTQTVTSTAYLDPDGNTVHLEKKDSLPTPGLEKRQRATPAIFSTLGVTSQADIRAACQCFGLVASTITRNTVIRATSTRVVQQTKTAFRTTTVATPLSTTVNVGKMTLVVTAPAPIVTATAVEIDNIYSCQADEDTTYLCPGGTDTDDGSMTSDGELSCPAYNDADGFSGVCAYYTDDGSPDTDIQWTLDVDGDGENIQTRLATYGNDDDSDCPAWADYTCAAPSGAPGGSRVKRTIIKTRKTRPAGLTRGGQYVPWEKAQSRLPATN